MSKGYKKLCIKIWMCLAVLGCITTLAVAAVVLSSYSFEPVIGPLDCKLRRIETQNCCYDKDCIYGKRYKYHFASNSSHCMSVYDIYNHPSNTSVHFTHITDCYPSLASLQSAHHDWRVNDSLIFYVNQQCTEWSSDAEHHEHVERNGMWIAIILSFVGCSCVSMLCGFLTMYHMETLSCVCTLCCCCLFAETDAVDDYDKNAHQDSSDDADEEEEEEEEDEEEADSRDTIENSGGSGSGHGEQQQQQQPQNVPALGASMKGLAQHIKMSRKQQFKYDGSSVSSSRQKPSKANKSRSKAEAAADVEEHANYGNNKNGVNARSSSATSKNISPAQHSRKKSKTKSKSFKLKHRTDDKSERSMSKELQKMTSADIAEMNGIISPAHVSHAHVPVPGAEHQTMGIVTTVQQPTLQTNLSGLSNSSNPMISRKRQRGQSNVSQPSKLSPLSRHDDEVKPWNHNPMKIQISSAVTHSQQSSNTPPLELEKHPSLQRKPHESTEAYNNRIVNRLIGKMHDSAGDHSNGHMMQYATASIQEYEHEREHTMDEMASTAAMSDSVYFDNEWYEESHVSYDPSKSPLGPMSRRSTRTMATIPGIHSSDERQTQHGNNNMLTPKPRKKLMKKTSNKRTASKPDDDEDDDDRGGVHIKIGLHSKDTTMSTNPKSDADDDDDDFYE